MKNLIKRTLRTAAASFALAGLLALPKTSLANQFFDLNGTTAGSGAANGGSYSFEGAFWATASTGTLATTTFVDGSFFVFSCGTDAATNTYTVTANANHNFAGIQLLAGGGTNVTLNGSGVFTLAAGLQGFFLGNSGKQLFIDVSITGPGEPQTSSSGSYYFYGTNSFTGGISLNSAAGVNFNNNSSFGTGPIFWNVAQVILADPAATAPIILSNAMVTRAASQAIFVTPTAAPVTFGGPWTNASGLSRLTENANTKIIITGQMYGTSGNILKDGVGILNLNCTNANAAVTITATNGLLELGTNAAISGTVLITNTAGALQIDQNTAITGTGTLQFTSAISNSAINLNYTGSDIVHSLVVDGVAQASGTYGSSASGATYILNQFTGNGTITVPATPVIIAQPQPEAAFIGASATFSVNVTGGAPITYQWYQNGVAISGANNSSYMISPVITGSAGTYYVAITNSVGFAISSNATLTVLPTNFYTTTVVADGPFAYYRLDETSGTNMLDAVSTNNGVYSNVTLGQPGFAATDPDTAFGLPTTTTARGYGNVPSNPNFNGFTGGSKSFTIECWAYLTNITGVQRLVSKLGSGTGYAFGINGNNRLRFTEGGVQDADITTAPFGTLSPNVWYQFVVTCDGFSAYTFYIDGVSLGSVPIGGVGIPNNGVGSDSTSPLAVGADPALYTFTAEQVYGRMDEVSFYASQLSGGQVLNHYNARYDSTVPPQLSAPTVNAATNYVSLPAVFTANAGGQNLTYQWFAPSGAVSGATASTYTIPHLALSDAGNYYVQVTNPNGTSNSPTVSLTVVSIPTNAAQLNITNALVLHLPFDGNSLDYSGRTNNGTNIGSVSYVSGIIGSNALHYSSAPGNFNYVTVGVRPDLQFSSNVDFTVSFWVRETNGSITNLPFFADGTTGASLGYIFSPYQTATASGGYQWFLNNVSAPSQFTPNLNAADVNLLNDGNWHNLTFVAQRSANLTTYVDGISFDSQAINFLTSIDSGLPANVGQDASGTYAVTAAADLDDLGVWKRTLSQFEISGLYLAGVSNSVSFAPVATAVNPVALTITSTGPNIVITWSGPGALQASTNAATGYTNVPSAVSPYTTSSSAPAMFYRLAY